MCCVCSEVWLEAMPASARCVSSCSRSCSPAPEGALVWPCELLPYACPDRWRSNTQQDHGQISGVLSFCSPLLSGTLPTHLSCLGVLDFWLLTLARFSFPSLAIVWELPSGRAPRKFKCSSYLFPSSLGLTVLHCVLPYV